MRAVGRRPVQGPTSNAAAAGLSEEELRGLIERRQAAFPTPAAEATHQQPGPQAGRSSTLQDPDRGVEL